MRFHRKPSSSGFSMLEITIAIGLLSIVCGLVVYFGGNLRNSVELTKLNQDVKVINSAAKLYLTNGGSFDGITNPQEVLDRMKASHTLQKRPTFVGMTGATIDKRLVASTKQGEILDFAAVWDPNKNQFVIQENATAGVVSFEINDALAVVEYADISRSPSALSYAEKPGWIWDYEERPPTFAGGPSSIPVGNNPDTQPPARPVPLLAPRISLSDPTFNSSTTEITVLLNNPNPAGSSETFYSLVAIGESHPPPSTWSAYSGAILTGSAAFPDGFEVATYAKSIDPGYLDSDSVNASTTSEFFNIPAIGNVLFIVDASSSMDRSLGSKSRFEATIDELVSAIDGLPQNLKFNVAMFDGSVHWTDGSDTLLPANQRNKQNLISKIRKVETGSGTNYSAGLGLPSRFKPIPDQVIFLSDGEPNDDRYLSELADLVRLGVRVDTIGLNSSRNGISVLQRIAVETGGSAQIIE